METHADDGPLYVYGDISDQFVVIKSVFFKTQRHF